MKIEVLVGMIASGKTTYARKRAKQGAIIVSHDDLTEMMHGEYRYSPALRQFYRDGEEALVGVAVRHGLDVVIDRTHLTSESRRRWTTFPTRAIDIMVHPEKPILVAVEFPRVGAREHVLRRFQRDDRGRTFDDWLAVAEHHAAQADAEPFGKDAAMAEGFHEYVRMPEQ